MTDDERKYKTDADWEPVPVDMAPDAQTVLEVALSPEQFQRAGHLAEAEGVTLAELLRHALDQYVAGRKAKEAHK